VVISEAVGIKTAACGLIEFADGTLAYIVKRYDRSADGARIHQEDMMQAMGLPNKLDTSKYSGTYEAVARKLSEIPGAGLVDAAEFIRRSMLMYLVGKRLINYCSMEASIKRIWCVVMNGKMTTLFDNSGSVLTLTDAIAFG